MSSLKIPENVDLFPVKLYTWFPMDEEEAKPDIEMALNYTVTQGGAEW